MNANDYHKIYLNIKEKAPIESGIQTLVYMFLYEIIRDTDLQLIVIDRMSKKTQFITSVGISDLAIVSDEFRFSDDNKEYIVSYVEVKGIGIKLSDFECQIKGQLLSRGKVLCTNGCDWKYYDINKYIQNHTDNEINFLWTKTDYEQIKNINDRLETIERTLAIKKSSYRHTQKSEYKEILNKEIEELENEKDETYKELEELYINITLLQEVMDSPIINRKLYNDGYFNVNEYMKLKSELYNVISEW